MTPMQLPHQADALPAFVDVAFALRGRTLPRDHGRALAAALGRHLPWLAKDPRCGVHRVKVVAGTGGEALLPQRARLLLRVPRERVAALAALAGVQLQVAGHALQLGQPRVHELLAHSTLYAAMVATDADADEGLFLRAMADELESLQVRGRCICGTHRQLQGIGGATVGGFSLMLDALTPADSLQLLQSGLGPHRLLGCGVFVPHRSAAALHAPA